MSDSDEEEKVPQRDEKEIAKEIEEKTWEAFMQFDKEGSGAVNSNEVQFVLEMVGIKFSQDEMFKMISELDPANTG